MASTSDLNDDTKLLILSFLKLRDIWSFGWTCHDHRRCVLTSRFLCQQLCGRLWPFLRVNHDNDNEEDGGESIHFTGSRMLRLGPENKSLEGTTNYPFYLRLVPDHGGPTEIDERFFQPSNCQNLKHRILPPQYYVPAFAFCDKQGNTRSNNNNNKNKTRVSYMISRVGPENHCIRSNHPFPRPIKNRVSRTHTRLRPFVLPHKKRNDRAVVDMSPRFLAYYEVTVLDEVVGDANENDCVAVGISDEKFTRNMHRHMPGWDAYSFGYHGDDGGLYHGVGSLVQKSFPTFGRGDTVGCGIDYTVNGIFFTLNGEWLGYGWTEMESLETRPWGPTIGIDTKLPVSCNLGGSEPFVFDLEPLLERSEKSVREGGLLLAEPLLSPNEHMKKLTLNDGTTKMYSAFDEETGLPTHWFDGEPLKKYQHFFAQNQFNAQKRKCDEYLKRNPDQAVEAQDTKLPSSTEKPNNEP